MHIAIQWNPSKTDTIGTENFVRYKGVSFTEGLFQPMEIQSRQSQVSVLSRVSAVEGCPLRGVPPYILYVCRQGMCARQVFQLKRKYGSQGEIEIASDE